MLATSAGLAASRKPYKFSATSEWTDSKFPLTVLDVNGDAGGTGWATLPPMTDALVGSELIILGRSWGGTFRTYDSDDPELNASYTGVYASDWSSIHFGKGTITENMVNNGCAFRVASVSGNNYSKIILIYRNKQTPTRTSTIYDWNSHSLANYSYYTLTPSFNVTDPAYIGTYLVRVQLNGYSWGSNACNDDGQGWQSVQRCNSNERIMYRYIDSVPLNIPQSEYAIDTTNPGMISGGAIFHMKVE